MLILVSRQLYPSEKFDTADTRSSKIREHKVCLPENHQNEHQKMSLKKRIEFELEKRSEYKEWDQSAKACWAICVQLRALWMVSLSEHSLSRFHTVSLSLESRISYVVLFSCSWSPAPPRGFEGSWRRVRILYPFGRWYSQPSNGLPRNVAFSWPFSSFSLSKYWDTCKQNANPGTGLQFRRTYTSHGHK